MAKSVNPNEAITCICVQFRRRHLRCHCSCYCGLASGSIVKIPNFSRSGYGRLAGNDLGCPCSSRQRTCCFAMLGVGLFISTIGLETAYGSASTFGTTWLLGGIPLIAMVLGLFGLSQALSLIFSNRVIEKSETEVDRHLLSGFVEVFRYPRTLSGQLVLVLAWACFRAWASFWHSFLLTQPRGNVRRHQNYLGGVHLKALSHPKPQIMRCLQPHWFLFCHWVFLEKLLPR